MAEIWRSTGKGHWGSDTAMIPIDQCPAGPWLDAAAAKAMGWKQAEQLGTLYWVDANGKCQYPVEDVEPTTIGPGMSWQDGDYEYGFQPSKDIAAAWDSLRNSLIERSDVGSVHVYNDHGQEFCEIERIYVDEDEGLVMASDDELAATAITRAFCKFHGITEVKIPND